MDQYLSIYEIRKLLSDVISSVSDSHIEKQLMNIDRKLQTFLDRGIDFKEIVDHLNDSVFITDSQGNVLYVNPAYEENTGIAPEEVIDKNIYELVGKDRLFTGGAVLDVMKKKKSVFRLSTTYRTNPPRIGYVSGTPIFDNTGELSQIIACSRPIVALRALQDDFEIFQNEINAMNQKYINKESEKTVSSHMIGENTSLKHICALIDSIAPTDATVLITGESGAGKEVLADRIYSRSLRNNEPFIKINCASIPPNLLESELFGYEKGAFSGANSKGKPGLFELANHGTLMLDEIGDMSMDLQVKLLRAIQNQEIVRIGGTKSIHLDIRFLACTNSNLKQKIADGTFRQDLYYRLNVIPINVPPLRERLEDLDELCQHFIDKFSRKYNRPFKLSERQLNFMKQYKWPGNIRELENIIEYLVLCSSGIGKIDDNTLIGLLNISQKKELPHTDTINDTETEKENNTDFNKAVSRFEKELLEQTLETSNNLREAGRKLNLNASTISRKIKQYNISYPRKKTDHSSSD